MQTKEPIYLMRRGYKSVVLVDAQTVENRLRVLRTFPELGCPYDSEFPSAMPHHVVLVTFADHKEIFCTVYLEHDVTPVVAIDWIRDMRMNPMAPFVSDDN